MVGLSQPPFPVINSGKNEDLEETPTKKSYNPGGH